MEQQCYDTLISTEANSDASTSISFTVDLAGIKSSIAVDKLAHGRLFYPLAVEVLTQMRRSESRGWRYLVGIVGGAGAGKSLFSKIFCKYLNTLYNLAGDTGEVCGVLSMDG